MGATRNCTFCDLEANPDLADETPFHLFFDCPTTKRVRIQFFIWLRNNDEFLISRHVFFCCGPGRSKCEVWTAVIYLVKFYGWECKLRRTMLSCDGLKIFVFNEVNVMIKLSKNFELKVSNSRINLNIKRIQG
jgi:hypothetical protein